MTKPEKVMYDFLERASTRRLLFIAQLADRASKETMTVQDIKNACTEFISLEYAFSQMILNEVRKVSHEVASNNDIGKNGFGQNDPSKTN